MPVKYYFIVNKSSTIEDLVRSTGISSSNFWFEYFLNIFSKHCIDVTDYAILIKTISNDQQKVIKLLAEYDIDGLSFINQKAFIFETNDSFFEHVSFKLIRSRKIKVISSDEFNTL